MSTAGLLASERVDERTAIALVLAFGRALHRYGTPSHRLEASLARLADTLGLEARFFSTPTAIFVGFGPIEAQRTSVVRAEPGETDLGKLSLLADLLGATVHGEVPVEAALARVEAILAAEPAYPVPLTLACFGVASGAGVVLFGGGTREIAVAAAIGVVVGLLALGSDRWGQGAGMLNPAAGLVAASMAGLATIVVGPIATFAAVLAGVITLLPGLSFTTAMTELATRNLASGSARFAGACVQLLGLGFGIALGSRLAVQVGKSGPPRAPTEWSASILVAAVVVGGLAISVLLRARVRDLVHILVASVVAFAGARLGARWLGAPLGAFVGSLVLGVVSNAYARTLERPAAVPLLPGLLVLVPGSIGLESVRSLLENDVVSGVEGAFTMMLAAMALAGGLIVANVALPAKRTEL